VAKKVLGRGLSNLLPGESPIQLQSESRSTKSSIWPRSSHPRPSPASSSTPADLQELAQTLHSVGLIEPIVVRPSGDTLRDHLRRAKIPRLQTRGLQKDPSRREAGG
jgi:hypothetical protein